MVGEVTNNILPHNPNNICFFPTWIPSKFHWNTISKCKQKLRPSIDHWISIKNQPKKPYFRPKLRRILFNYAIQIKFAIIQSYYRLPTTIPIPIPSKEKNIVHRACIGGRNSLSCSPLHYVFFGTSAGIDQPDTTKIFVRGSHHNKIKLKLNGIPLVCGYFSLFSLHTHTLLGVCVCLSHLIVRTSITTAANMLIFIVW